MNAVHRLIVLIVATVLMTACGTNRSNDAESDNEAAIAASSGSSKAASCKGVSTMEKPWSPGTILLNFIQDDRLRAGTKAPEFSLPDLTGIETALYDVIDENEVVLINFWASWCAPCIKKIPDLKQLYADHGEKGFEIVFVSIDYDYDDWKEASGEYELPWIDLRDTVDQSGGVSGDYAIEAIPASLLLDSRGCIQHTYMPLSQLDRYLSSKLPGESAKQERESTS